MTVFSGPVRRTCRKRAGRTISPPDDRSTPVDWSGWFPRRSNPAALHFPLLRLEHHPAVLAGPATAGWPNPRMECLL